jgi:hypothetical protein|tara:strand:- start:62103 stop:62762 length:660 start_codon:yes stop_codon:yes gene_type:complete
MIIYDLENIAHEYVYIKDRDYTLIQDRFLKNTLKALDYLHQTDALTIVFLDDGSEKTLDIIDVLTADSTNGINIIYSEARNYYNPSTNTVGFYDTHGVFFRKNHRKKWFSRNRGYNSPMAVLAHELIHCYNELYETEDYIDRKQDYSSRGKKLDHAGHDLSYPNKEEEFVIRMTNQVAKRLGEDKRSNYGRSYYEVDDVCSPRTKGEKPKGRIAKFFKI